MHSLLRMLAVIAVAVALAGAGFATLLMRAQSSCAAPAYPAEREVTQPNGCNITVRLWGDEYAHGWETLDGHTVAHNEATDYWEYAVLGADGDLAPSGARVTVDPAPVPAHLRPAEALIEERKAELAAPLLAANGAGAAALDGTGSAAGVPAWAGSDTDLLFIKVAFADVPCVFTGAEMQTNMFGGGASGPGDLDDYYREVSRGALELDGRVAGCFTLPNTKRYYDAATGGGARGLVHDAVALADSTVDFANFDNDGDGFVDALGVIYAGGGPHDFCDTDEPPLGRGGDQLWPHSSGTGGTETGDGVMVNPFIIMSEITWAISDMVCDEIQTVGLFVHEFGHSLGLPDLYDIDRTSAGIGSWSAMSSQFLSTVNLADTPAHFDPWSKWFLGWISPADYTGQDVGAAIPQVETSGFVAQLGSNPGGAQIGGTGEYFLIENRQRTGFDAMLPGCGLLVWHIDDALAHNRREGHTATSHRLVDIEEADAPPEDMEISIERGDAGDPFPGSSKQFDWHDTTNPNARFYSGIASGFKMKVASTECAPVMHANFGNPAAELEIVQTESRDPAVAGDRLSYDVTVTNRGPAAATNVIVVDWLPPAVAYLSDTESWCTELPVDELTCFLGNMLAGDVITFSIEVKVDAGLVGEAGAPASILSTVFVRAQQPDHDLANSEHAVTTTVGAAADLAVAMTTVRDRFKPSTTVKYTISATNNGPSDAQAVRIISTLPPPTAGRWIADTGHLHDGDGCALDGSTLTCEVGRVPAGGSVSIDVYFRVIGKQGAVTSSAQASSATADSNLSNNTAMRTILVQGRDTGPPGRPAGPFPGIPLLAGLLSVPGR